MKNFENIKTPHEYHHKLAQLATLNDALMAMRSVQPMPPVPVGQSVGASEVALPETVNAVAALHAKLTNEVMDLHEGYMVALADNFERVMQETRLPVPGFATAPVPAMPVPPPPPMPKGYEPPPTPPAPHPFPPPATPVATPERSIPRPVPGDGMKARVEAEASGALEKELARKVD